MTHSTILGGVKGTLDTSGDNTKTALTTISQNIQTAGNGQGSSLTSLLAEIRNLDNNNKNGLDDILTNIGGIKSVLDLIGASTHARTNLDHHDADHIVTRHGTLNTAPQHSFIDESTVNVQPEQTDNQQTGIKATAGSFSDDKNNPQSGGSECGGGLFTGIGCNVQLQLGRTLPEDVNRTSPINWTMPTLGFKKNGTSGGSNQTHLTNDIILPSSSALQDLQKTGSEQIVSR